MSLLKYLMKEVGLSQRALARGLALSPATVNEIVNRDNWPKSLDRKELQSNIRKQLRDAGVGSNRVSALFRSPSTRKSKPAAAVATTQEETPMLLARQELFPETKRHFGLVRNPFGEVTGPEEVFLSADIRYVREAMFLTARKGGFIAVIGESGSGKSTLRKELVDRINREKQAVHIIEPYVLAMEDNDKTGKTLKAQHLAEAVLATVAPSEALKSSPEARFRQLHRVLRDSANAGASHCLIIEEAHGLPITTLKHLKRFLELEDGFRKLLSIILLGQPELKHKLSESNAQVREVVQRCEKIELRPMNGSLPEYIKFRFARVEADAEKIITADAIEALRSNLTGATSRSGVNDSVSLVYPLAVGNLVVAAMNLAANVGSPQVTPEIVNQV
ncbi:AAA family ATPase [Pseudodesulfovibrio indicus]|uniref:Transposase n=1 Tax=Pseudodesulfovibrio indicus TaxID=1716143 RepID=A0A140D8V7_9BACT|nr:AAA family ATPase [Pseudodesulfovibrio indicus]AMK09624.1 transposase [Pseudodesulfovibrio indicus]TDT86428.1 type II secretory pathway predicted ATPase ExeA [Pseudodesulfovibrio indicus]